MPTYIYKAISEDDMPVSGIVEASDEFEAIDRIRASCKIVESITKAPNKADRQDIKLETKISYKTLSLLCSQFSIILAAGIPIVRATQLIQDQISDKTLKKLLEQVEEDVSSGHRLSMSLETRGGKILPKTFIESLKAGEESGTLEKTFYRLENYYDKSFKMKSKVRSALMYPAFLAVLAVVVIAVIMVVTMPIFVNMFDSMGADMPGLTVGLIKLSGVVYEFWWLIVLIFIIITVVFRLYSTTEAGNLNLNKLYLKVPILGKVSSMKGASQFANTMSTLLAAGLPLVDAVSITGNVIDNHLLGAELEEIVPLLEEGQRLGTCLKQNTSFPELLFEMTAVGEETGFIEETLETIGAYYDNEVETATKRALDMLQPVITVVLGIVIGVIVVALYLPMFTMYAVM